MTETVPAPTSATPADVPASAAATPTVPLLAVNNLVKYYPIHAGVFRRTPISADGTPEATAAFMTRAPSR